MSCVPRVTEGAAAIPRTHGNCGEHLLASAMCFANLPRAVSSTEGPPRKGSLNRLEPASGLGVVSGRSRALRPQAQGKPVQAIVTRQINATGSPAPSHVADHEIHPIMECSVPIIGHTAWTRQPLRSRQERGVSRRNPETDSEIDLGWYRGSSGNRNNRCG